MALSSCTVSVTYEVTIRIYIPVPNSPYPYAILLHPSTGYLIAHVIGHHAGAGPLWKPGRLVAYLPSLFSAGFPRGDRECIFHLELPPHRLFSHLYLRHKMLLFADARSRAPRRQTAEWYQLLPPAWHAPHRSLLEPIVCGLGSPPELIHCDDPIKPDRNALSPLLCLLGWMIVNAP